MVFFRICRKIILFRDKSLGKTPSTVQILMPTPFWRRPRMGFWARASSRRVTTTPGDRTSARWMPPHRAMDRKITTNWQREQRRRAVAGKRALKITRRRRQATTGTCSGWAYGTIGNSLPLPLLTQILTVVG